MTLHTDKFRNGIHFANGIMTNRMHIKVEQHLRYNLKIWNKNDAFDKLNDISENVTLVQVMDKIGNVNRAINIIGYWIFESNYEKALCTIKESLDVICSCSVCEEQVENFESVFYLVRYMWAPINLKIGYT